MEADTRWPWAVFCGTNVTGLPAWHAGDFGHCFEKLVFVSVSHAILALVVAIQLGKHSKRAIRGPIALTPSICVRCAATVILFLITIVAPLLNKFLLDREVSWVDVVAYSISAFAWLMHSIFLGRLQRFYHLSIRGPPSILICVLVIFACVIIQLHTAILNMEHHTDYVSIVQQCYIYISLACHVTYWASVVPSRRPSLEISPPRLNVQDPDVDSLLGGPLDDSSFSDIFEDEDLGVGEERTSWLSKLTFWWVTALMAKGSRQGLERTADLFQLPSKLDTERLEQQFQMALRPGEHEESQHISAESPNLIPHVRVIHSSVVQHNDSRTLMSALNKCFGCEYYSLGILKLLADMLGFGGPILLNLLVTYIETPSEPASNGYWYAAGLFLTTFLTALLSTHFNYLMEIVGLKVRAAIITTVYRKALQVTTVEMNKFSTGQVVNFMSTDTDRVVNFCRSFHQFWSLPFQVAVSLYLLYQQLGLAFLTGLGFAILLIPINRAIAIKIGQLSTEMMRHKDERVKMMNEILQGMRVVKLYAWEVHFAERINDVRALELRSLKGRKYLDALCVYFWATTPVLISILTFTTYALMGNQLTAAKVFTSLALFSILISPLNAFPWVINGLMEAWVSLKRLQAFADLQEHDWSKYYAQRRDVNPGTSIEVYDGSFSWISEPPRDTSENEPDEELITDGTSEVDDDELIDDYDTYNSNNGQIVAKPMCLQNISFRVQKGILVGVVGEVGSGKSSLLSALLGEMARSSGQVTVPRLDEGFGLTTQEAWIQQGTIQDNILFGRVMERQRYDRVLEACALLPDLEILPAGDKTEIGENGLTLSGGQKARVALARAVYQDKPIYLLDDPLSAVDSHVARHIFSKCITGLLGHRTRILCTHHTQYLQEADIVIQMENGKIRNIGSPQSILPSSDLEEVAAAENPVPSAALVHGTAKSSTPAGGEGDLVEAEEQETGSVKMDVYRAYWQAVGSCLASSVLLALFLMQASRNISDWWLSYWVTHSHGSQQPGNESRTSLNPHTLYSIHSTYHSLVALNSLPWQNVTTSEDNVTFYLMVYGILAGANSLFTLFRSFLFAYGGICAATMLHRQLLSSVLQAPVNFFDATPIGRILNRFSSDLYTVDDSLPFILNILLAQLFGLLGTLVVTCYGLPWFMLLLPPLGVLYYVIQKYYRRTSREVKRITSVTLSPIYAHFSESVSGLVTIRALRHVPRFCSENRRRLEANQCAQFSGLAASQWLNIRLQMLGVAMVTGVAFIAVFEHHFHEVNAGLIGLAISYALSITSLMSGVVTSFTETEKQMVSVERVQHYINNIPKEKNDSILSVPPFWPIQGAVTFQRVCLRYRVGLPLALNNVSFETQPAEKVGIVGRTGSGKSSLFSVLFRLVDIEGGHLLIDGIGLRHLDVRELRSKLAIIPQDPFLFSGSIRDNLDPTSEYLDRYLWLTLERCRLRAAVEALGGLDTTVGERGHKLSAGQRQLLCLARAMLIKAKVLCIDEATASVDFDTDQHLQRTIREEFANHTVLTIAHRIQTVMDSDRVLVMDKGRVMEYDPPDVLLENKHSLFYSLIHGKSSTDCLDG